MQAVTINNRAFELLSRGLPLLYCPLPALLQAPPELIRVCQSAGDYINAFEQARSTFGEVQERIESFLADHTEESRYQTFIDLCSRLGEHY